MARLASLTNETAAALSEGVTLAAATTYDNTLARTGTWSLKCNGNAQGATVSFSVAQGNTLYIRSYINIAVMPATAAAWLLVVLPNGGLVQLNTTGTLELRDNNNSLVGSPSAALSTGVWYRVELACTLSASGTAGSLDARLDGVSFASLSGTATTGIGPMTSAQIGTPTGGGATAITINHDDIALNDSTGTQQNSYPGPGRLGLLLPTSDNARVGFTAGAGATTNLWDAVNNQPPVGVVLASATNTSQIKDTTNNATDTYDANLATIASLGIAGQVALVTPIVVHGNSTVTSRTNGIQLTANPVIAEVTGTTGTTAAATFPTGWTRLAGTTAYVPAMNPATNPVMRFRKGTASVDASMAALMALIVEIVGVGPPFDGGRRVSRNSLLRR